MNPGDPVTYRLVVTNTGAATLDALTVTDTVAPLVLHGETADAPGVFGPVVVTSVPGSGSRY